MPDDRLIVALDPGKVTGVALFTHGKNSVATFEYELDDVFELLNRVRSYDTLVVENFIIRPGLYKKTRVYEPLWIIGACKYVADLVGCELVFQEPSEAKVWADRSRLKKFGLDKSLMVGEHRFDALRHLSLYMGKQKLLGLLGLSE